MIYICTHAAPLYTLDCSYNIVNNNDTEYLLNIANKGNRYRHLRGIYNIYKNYNLPDEIGVFQYRRYLPYKNIPNGYRCVVPFNNILNATIVDIYNDKHNIEDLRIVEQIINEKEFTEYINYNYDEQYYHSMFILNKEDFNNYCKFVFDTLFEFDAVKNDNDLETPVCSFLGERLGSYWIYKNIPREQRFLADVIEFNKPKEIQNTDNIEEKQPED